MRYFDYDRRRDILRATSKDLVEWCIALSPLFLFFVVNVDCKGNWQKKGECGAQCDGISSQAAGKQTMEYIIETEKANNGKDCEAQNGATRQDDCQKTDCPSTIFWLLI